jgi:PST family polysaccharide transporter
MSAERTVAKNTAWAVLQPLLMNVLSLAATGYIARKLGVVEYGQFNLGYAFVAMFAPLTNLGLRALAIRHVAANRDQAAEYLGKVLVLRLILALVVAGIAALAIPLSGGTGHTRDVILIAIVGMIVTTLGGVLSDGFEAYELMRSTSLARFAGGLLLTIASVAALYFGGGIREMAVAYILGPVCTLVLLWYWSRGKPFHPRPGWDLPEFWQMLRQASPFFLIALLDVICTRIDVLVLARALGGADLGSYTAAMNLVDRSMVLCDGAATALLPAIAHLHAQAPESAVPLLRKFALWLLLASLPVAVVTTATSGLVVHVLYGPGYGGAAAILAVAIWRLPIACLTALQSQTLLAVHRQDLVLRTGTVGMAISLVLLWPMVHWFGPIGAAWVMLLRHIISFVLRLEPMARQFPRLWPWPQMARVAAALALMWVPLAFVSSTGINLESVALLLSSGTLYGAMLALMRVDPMPKLLARFARGSGLRAQSSGLGTSGSEL